MSVIERYQSEMTVDTEMMKALMAEMAGQFERLMTTADEREFNDMCNQMREGLQKVGYMAYQMQNEVGACLPCLPTA